MSEYFKDNSDPTAEGEAESASFGVKKMKEAGGVNTFSPISDSINLAKLFQSFKRRNLTHCPC